MMGILALAVKDKNSNIILCLSDQYYSFSLSNEAVLP